MNRRIYLSCKSRKLKFRTSTFQCLLNTEYDVSLATSFISTEHMCVLSIIIVVWHEDSLINCRENRNQVYFIFASVSFIA